MCVTVVVGVDGVEPPTPVIKAWCKFWIGANGKATKFSDLLHFDSFHHDSWQNLTEVTREALVCP
jgi:hypothetical protein